MERLSSGDQYKENRSIAYQDDETTFVIAKMTESVIPTATEMENYKAVDPEFPKTIMRWAEENLKHHRDTQRSTIFHKFWESTIRNVFGFLSVLAICITGGLFCHWGHPNQGAAIIATVIGLAGVFVIKKYAEHASPPQ